VTRKRGYGGNWRSNEHSRFFNFDQRKRKLVITVESDFSFSYSSAALARASAAKRSFSASPRARHLAPSSARTSEGLDPAGIDATAEGRSEAQNRR